MARTDKPTVLVPIRYPITTQSKQTLIRASELVDECEAQQLLVMHVNLFQHGQSTSEREIRRAIKPFTGDQPVSVRVCPGFLVEEVIRDETEANNADIVVLGQNQKPMWRRFLSRILGNDPAIASHLRDHTDATVEVVG